MTYWNLIEQYGPDVFARDLAAARGAGVITPDLTPDEADEWIAATDAHGLDRIFLIAPSSTPERIAMTMAACRGWVYATSVMGVTGVRQGTSQAAPVIVARARRSIRACRSVSAWESATESKPQRSAPMRMRSLSAPLWCVVWQAMGRTCRGTWNDWAL